MQTTATQISSDEEEEKATEEFLDESPTTPVKGNAVKKESRNASLKDMIQQKSIEKKQKAK